MLAWFPRVGQGEEPFLAFLDGLRQRGYYETALDYLASIEEGGLASNEQRALVPFERAMTLVAYSRTQRDIDNRLQYLNQAEQQLRQFVDSQSEHPKAFAARSELANLIVERARINLEQAKSGDTESLVQQARQQFQRAIDELNALAEIVSAELEAIPKVLDTRDRKEAALAQRRTQLRADNLQTELLAAAIREESAGTYGDGSSDQLEQLAAAAEQYDAIYKKYRSRLAGLYARMYQGRCNAQMGKTKDALAYYGDLLAQPDEPADMRRLKTETLRLAMDCWLAPNERKYLEAIKQATRWIETVPRDFQRDADMLAIRLSLARAFQMQAEDFARRGMNQMMVSQSMVAAREHAEFVAGEEGPLRDAAQALAETLGSQRLETGPVEPTTFAEAAREGRALMDQIGPVNQQVLTLRGQLQSAIDRDEIQSSLADAERKLTETIESALEFYRLAMQLADSSTPPSELDLARYFVCYLHYVQGDRFRAAVAGEFVARKQPESDAALQCAKIALVCYNDMLSTAEESSDRRFELQRIFDLTRYIAVTWPETPDAVEVLAAAVPTMANHGQFERARELTDLIPENSTARWQADFITGHAMRGELLRRAAELQSPSDTTPADANQEVAQLSAVSRLYLMNGIERMPADPGVSAFNVAAMLLAAESLLEDDRPAQAVEVLEHPALGPVTLMQAEHPVLSDPLLRRQSLQLALRAYVGSIDQDESIIAKAKSAMTELQAAVGSDPQGKQQMLAIYVQLARSIEQQLKSADGQDKQRLSQVFEAFLNELTAGASDTGVLLWVAETYVSLGVGFDDNPQMLHPMAQQYYSQSAAALTNLLVVTADPTLATQVRARLAAVKGMQRDYAGALSEFQQLLQAQPNAVNLQVEAARMLGQWGTSDPQQYQRAVAGIGEGPGRVIWGWAKIASATMSHANFRETFYEARYEVARCSTERAKTLQGAERDQQLALAGKTLRTTRQLYPDLAQTTWAPLYSSLEKQIESLR